MAGLPGPLLRKLRATLRECGPFATDRQLLAVFEDERLEPWKYQIQEAYSRHERVDYFISEFLNRRTRAGQSVLALFLQVLYEEAVEQDECYGRLNDMAVEVALATGSDLPVLAQHNLWRAATARAGQTPPASLGGYGLPDGEEDAARELAALPSDLPSFVFQERLEALKNKKKADWLPVRFLEQGLAAAGAVGRVEYGANRVGTAFLVAPDLVLTNAHVLKYIPTLTEGGVRFLAGPRGAATWHDFAASVLVSPAVDLDFALLRLRVPATAAPLRFSARKPYVDQAANILQYPQGNALQVALRYNAIVRVDDERFYYVSDTDFGSSGSPVFDDDWLVIGLHRAGIADSDNHPLKHANQGIPITAILPRLRAHIHA